MRLEYLEDFVALAEATNFEQAAYKRYTTQSSFSKHIQSLEDELGEPLVYHDSGRSYLTDFGRDFIICARKHIELDRAFRSRHSSIPGFTRTILQLGYESYLAPYRLFEAVQSFQKDFPYCSIILYDNSIWEHLNRGTLDMAVVVQRSETAPLYQQYVLTTDHFVLAVPESSPLAGQQTVSFASLADEKFILLQKRCDLHSAIKSVCHENGFLPKTVLTLPSCHNVMKMVSEGHGISILPLRMAESNALPGVRLVEPYEPYPISVCLIYEKEHTLSNLEQALIDKLTKEANTR